jgi:hypothetical protein
MTTTRPLRGLGVRRTDVTNFGTKTLDAAHPTIPREDCRHVGAGHQFVGRIWVTQFPRVLQEVFIDLSALQSCINAAASCEAHHSNAWHRENLITQVGRPPHPAGLDTALHWLLNYIGATYVWKM